MNRRVTISILFLSLFWSQTQGQIQLTDDGNEPVLGRLEYLRDPENLYTLSTVREQSWVPVRSDWKAPGFGFDHTTYWFRFEVTNASRYSDWLLEVAYAPLDDIQLFVQDASGEWTEHRDGDLYPIDQRDLYYRHPIFKTHFEPGETVWVYVRVNTISSVQVPLIFWESDAFHSASSRMQMINGLFFGAMLIMVLYQMFLYLTMRDTSTLYYILTLISMANVIGFFEGYNFLYFHPSIPRLNDDFAALSGPLFILSSALLTRSFLNLPSLSKLLDRILLANTVAAIGAGVLMVILHRQISYKYHHLFTLFHSMIVLTSAAYCLFKRYRPALFYLIAWATLLLAAAVFTMGNLGLVPGFLGTNFIGLMIGCVLQVVLISLALGERWNQLVKENQEVKEMELRRRQEENVRLENEVRLRTEELTQQKVQLEELNKIKDKLFSVVSHDIKEPLTSLKLSVALARMDKLSQDEFKSISAELDNHLDRTTEFIQNLLQWAKFQLRGESINLVSFNINQLIDEVISVMSHTARQKGISIVKETSESELVVKADIVMIQSVVRNLISNAIKFSPVGGTITLVTQELPEGAAQVSVQDAGVGIARISHDKIFTLENVATKGTRSESGTGLGLVLCREFVEKNSGKIWFESAEGKGTSFHFSLPVGDAHELTSWLSVSNEYK